MNIWIKYLIIICVFYVSAVLQKSFFTHFSLGGGILNLVFCFFILFIFFSVQNRFFYWEIIFYATTAGFFLDIYSSLPMASSVLILLVIGLLIKKFQFELLEKDETHPFFYFVSVFLFSFLFYIFCLNILLYFLDGKHIFTNLNFKFVTELMYNLFFASIIFILYKRFFKESGGTKQMPLF
jgi:hypothetical protein